MAIRWRADGTLVCAYMSDAKLDDTYIDDNLHYRLTIEGVIVPDPKHKVNGLWHWSKDVTR